MIYKTPIAVKQNARNLNLVMTLLVIKVLQVCQLLQSADLMIKGCGWIVTGPYFFSHLKQFLGFLSVVWANHAGSYMKLHTYMTIWYNFGILPNRKLILLANIKEQFNLLRIRNDTNLYICKITLKDLGWIS